ncbi:MAG: PepSY domain-containing protein [Gammaproteobacteria bacterium]|jgi:uncharacterized membrane protein YkoI|nr:PepSY domain-containing protein [Gammaproteobacteria bacterium]MBT4495114.1 PepSY domain-containing protein [Gammaproteobacteria bacterium]MBT7370518.1 PepSY domain-containing protein [Gammaproteobacteria bacterium]
MNTKLTTHIFGSVLIVLALLSGPLLADEKKQKKSSPSVQVPASSKLAPSTKGRISNSRAASLVKKKYSGTRVLGVSRLERGDSPMFKVRTLSKDGVVKSVFVDGRTGEVFE